jgi:predicted type IV restriction endonuclease
MDRSGLREYTEYAGSRLDSNPRMNEANTKLKLLQEFVSTLGWDVPGKVDPEYPVTVGSRTHYVDYALKCDGATNPSVFVEAKPSATDLSSDDRDQLRSYMLTSNVGWGILANGWEYEFLWRRTDGDEVAVHTLGVLPYDELPDEYELIRAYTPEALSSGESRSIAERIHAYDHAATVLEQERERLESEFVDELANVAGDIIKEDAHRIVASALERIVESARNRGGSGTEEPERSRSEFWREVEDVTGIKNREGAVTLPDGSAREAFVAFVRFLVNQGYLTDSDVPIESGYKRYLLNTEPVDQEGDRMTSPERIGDYYLETNYSSSDIKQRIAELGERVRESD